jgi:hypothetical protein
MAGGVWVGFPSPAFAAGGGDQTLGCSLAALVTMGMRALSLATVALNFRTELLISVLGLAGFAHSFNSSRLKCLITAGELKNHVTDRNLLSDAPRFRENCFALVVMGRLCT